MTKSLRPLPQRHEDTKIHGENLCVALCLGAFVVRGSANMSHTQIKRTMNKIQCISIFTLSLLLMGCTPLLYIPNKINAPLMAEKNDFRVNLGINQTGGPASFEGQGAYALSDNVGIMVNYSGLSKAEEGNNGQHYHHLLEGGIGVFEDYGKELDHGKLFRAELFLGAGKGWARDVVIYDPFVLFGSPPPPETNFYKGRYQRYFIQPAVGLAGNVVGGSFSLRCSWVSFQQFLHEVNGAQNVINYNGGLAFATIEPAFTVRVGYKGIKFFTQIGNLFPLGSDNSDFNEVTNFENIFLGYARISTGITLSPWIKTPAQKQEEALKSMR